MQSVELRIEGIDSIHKFENQSIYCKFGGLGTKSQNSSRTSIKNSSFVVNIELKV
ncbi:MAG: hypothetical protein MHMPM18_005043, partial [Marteilia pararefringens]